MVDYILGLTGIVLLSTILTNVLPTGKTAVLIKNIVRLCAYLSILTPAFNFFNKELSSSTKILQDYFSEEVIQTDNSYIQYCSEKTVENVEKVIRERLLTEYSVETTVRLLIEDSETPARIKIEKIEIDGSCISTETQSRIKNDFEKEFSVDIEFTKGG